MYRRKHLPIFIAATLSVFIISFSIWYVRHWGTESSAHDPVTPEERLAAVPGVSADDHILGNPTAPIIFYVYSDFGCPYCKDYHETLRMLVKIFGQEGKVAMVFRHMPYVQLHPESPMYAHASECVSEELGNAGFWNFSDLLFERADPIQPFDAAGLVLLAEESGASRKEFIVCMKSNKFMSSIESEFTEAISAGAKGTPFTIVEVPTGRTVYQGAQPFKSLAISVQTAIRSLDIEELKPPSSESQEYIQAFESLDTGSDASTSTGTTTISE